MGVVVIHLCILVVEAAYFFANPKRFVTRAFSFSSSERVLSSHTTFVGFMGTLGGRGFWVLTTSVGKNTVKILNYHVLAKREPISNCSGEEQ